MDSAQALRRRCALAHGTWCSGFHAQTPIPTKPVPRGNKDCPNDCSGWGHCNHDTGYCYCPAGRGGFDCGLEVKRPCTKRLRDADIVNNPNVESHIGPDKHDLNLTAPGWLASRCAGYCYDDLAACFCGFDSKLRHIPAPPGSPPWTPPQQWGRSLPDSCQPRTDPAGAPTFVYELGGVDYDKIYGPAGWCNSRESEHKCGCVLEVAWPCDGSVPMESTCANQCSGHGECFWGFCRCHPGWYGADCSRKRAGLAMEIGLHEGPAPARPWLREAVVTPPAALEVPAVPTRLRPLIYVYDVPPQYTSHMHQYRIFSDACVWRRWHDGNHTGLTSWTYAVEPLLHELMLQSEHRTYDPEEADFFYVPLYLTCYFWPVMGWADFPWWHAPKTRRVMHGANMMTELQEWLVAALPYWARRGGRDHIWLAAADEGACWMPRAVYEPSIVLTHWGRLGADHVSGTAYVPDDYSANDTGSVPPGWRGMDWQEGSRGHACYDPRKDLVIPAFKPPGHFQASPLLGAPPLERDILLFFRGDIGLHRMERYSRRIRQRLYTLAVERDWFARHRVVIGTGAMIPGDYSSLLARSNYCLVAPGDGWSPRAEDALLHGCVPLVVMDGVHAVFEGILDWPSMSVRVQEAALEAVPDILAAIPPERLAAMQRRIARVAHRFAYARHPALRRELVAHLENNAARRQQQQQQGGPAAGASGPPAAYPEADDAFGTIMQWLHGRIPHTR